MYVLSVCKYGNAPESLLFISLVAFADEESTCMYPIHCTRHPALVALEHCCATLIYHKQLAFFLLSDFYLLLFLLAF